MKLHDTILNGLVRVMSEHVCFETLISIVRAIVEVCHDLTNSSQEGPEVILGKIANNNRVNSDGTKRISAGLIALLSKVLANDKKAPLRIVIEAMVEELGPGDVSYMKTVCHYCFDVPSLCVRSHNRD